jgi:hypothetical protein
VHGLFLQQHKVGHLFKLIILIKFIHGNFFKKKFKKKKKKSFSNNNYKMLQHSSLFPMLLLVTCMVAMVCAQAPTPADFAISALPGFNSGSTSSKFYSGYITVNETNGRALFFLFAQSAATNAPL